MIRINWGNLLRRTQQELAERRPIVEISTGLSLLLAGSVLALREGPKIQKDIQKKKDELGKEKLDAVETVQATWKHVLPVVIADAAGSALVIDGYNTEHKRALGFASAAGIAEETLRLTREKEKEIVGEKKANEIQAAVAEDEVATIRKRQDIIYETGHGNQLIVDRSIGITLRADMEWIFRRQNEFNNRLKKARSLPVSEWLDCIGVRPEMIPASAYVFEFNIDRDIYGRPIPDDAEKDLMKMTTYSVMIKENGEHYTEISYNMKPKYTCYNYQVFDTLVEHSP